MKFKNSIYCCIAFFAMLGNVNAKNPVVAYHCPTVHEADHMNIRTSINDKDVRWYIDSNNSRGYDRPADFMEAVLERKSEDSFDMSVKCVYKTQENKKYVLIPVESYLWYVDAVAEKAIGNKWVVDHNGRLRCNGSVTDCAFYFR